MTVKRADKLSNNHIKSDSAESMRQQGWRVLAHFRADAHFHNTIMEGIIANHPEKAVTFTSGTGGIFAWVKDRKQENRIADLSAIERIEQVDPGYLVGQVRIGGVSFEAEFIRVHSTKDAAQECAGGETARKIWKEFQALSNRPFNTIKVPGFEGQWVLIISPKTTSRPEAVGPG